MGFKEIVSFIMSLLMTLMSTFFPGLFQDKTIGITNGDWLTLVVTEFGMEEDTYSESPYYTCVPADNEYFAVVQIAFEWGIILAGEIKNINDYATNDFISKTLSRVATGVSITGLNLPEGKSKASMADAIKALQAVHELWANRETPDVANADFVAAAGVADLSDIPYIVDGGRLIYAAEKFNVAVGGRFIAGANDFNITGAAYKVLAVVKEDGLAYVDVEKVELEQAVQSIDFEGNVVPDFSKAEMRDNKGDIIQQGTVDDTEAAPSAEDVSVVSDAIDKAKGAINNFLANPKVSFSIKGFKVKLAADNVDYKDKSVARIDLSIGGNVVDGVYVEKAYSLTNISYDTKYDANLARLKINEAYLIMNYDLTETTVLRGSYAASVVPDEDIEFDEGADFLSKLKTSLGNLSLVKGGGIEVPVFSYTIPIGATGLTIDMTISLSISACGRIEIIVKSNEVKGYEIINNKGRYISESTILDRYYNIQGDFQVVLGINVYLSFLGIKIVDVGFQGGIGAYVYTRIYNIMTHYSEQADVAYDVVIEAVSGMPNLDELRICTAIQLYGILRFSVGEKSIISKIGLSKTWTIYDRSNAVFAELYLVDGRIVDLLEYENACI